MPKSLGLSVVSGLPKGASTISQRFNFWVEITSFQFCVCVCVCVLFAYVHIHVCVYMWGVMGVPMETRGQPTTSSFIAPHPNFLNELSPIWLDGLIIQLQKCVCLCSPAVSQMHTKSRCCLGVGDLRPYWLCNKHFTHGAIFPVSLLYIWGCSFLNNGL